MTNALLLDALVNWVENGVEPDHLVAQVNPTRTRKVCMYPDVPIYTGSGSTDDEANFVCQTMAQDDPTLLDQEAALLEGRGPLPWDFDIDELSPIDGKRQH